MSGQKGNIFLKKGKMVTSQYNIENTCAYLPSTKKISKDKESNQTNNSTIKDNSVIDISLIPKTKINTNNNCMIKYRQNGNYMWVRLLSRGGSLIEFIIAPPLSTSPLPTLTNKSEDKVHACSYTALAKFKSILQWGYV